MIANIFFRNWKVPQVDKTRLAVSKCRAEQHRQKLAQKSSDGLATHLKKELATERRKLARTKYYKNKYVQLLNQ